MRKSRLQKLCSYAKRKYTARHKKLRNYDRYVTRSNKARLSHINRYCRGKKNKSRLCRTFRKYNKQIFSAERKCSQTLKKNHKRRPKSIKRYCNHH